METQGGGREKNQHHEVRSSRSYPSLEVFAPRREAGLCSQIMDISVHPYVQSSFDGYVSWYGEILSRIPLDQ